MASAQHSSSSHAGSAGRRQTDTYGKAASSVRDRKNGVSRETLQAQSKHRVVSEPDRHLELRSNWRLWPVPSRQWISFQMEQEAWVRTRWHITYLSSRVPVRSSQRLLPLPPSGNASVHLRGGNMPGCYQQRSECTRRSCQRQNLSSSAFLRRVMVRTRTRV